VGGDQLRSLENVGIANIMTATNAYRHAVRAVGALCEWFAMIKGGVWVGLGILEGDLTVNDDMTMMLLALQFGFMAFILMKLEAKKGEADRIEKLIEKNLNDFNLPDLNFDSLKEDLMEMVEDIMANMRIPTIADHAAGALSQFMQMKQMKMAQDFGLVPPTEHYDEETGNNMD